MCHPCRVCHIPINYYYGVHFHLPPLRAEKYGDTADECGEAFFLCGKALLELARYLN